jgi:hypothetical protein
METTLRTCGWEYREAFDLILAVIKSSEDLVHMDTNDPV